MNIPNIRRCHEGSFLMTTATSLRRFGLLMTAAMLLFMATEAFCDPNPPEPPSSVATQTPSASALDNILKGIEQRYEPSGFTADFVQASTLKMMKITDTATGKAAFQRPGMMRWEYLEPDQQQIITDGKTLWIYKPEDNQVVLGKADAFFADGSGASFLSDIVLIRKKFDIELATTGRDNHEVLKLVPKEKNIDLSRIYITVTRKTFDVIQIVSYNTYGDETRLSLSNIRFDEYPDDSRFKFQIPAGVDILYLDE